MKCLLKGVGILILCCFAGGAIAATCKEEFKTNPFLAAKASIFNHYNSKAGYAHSSDLYGGTRIISPSASGNKSKPASQKKGEGYKPSSFEEKSEHFIEREFSIFLK